MKIMLKATTCLLVLFLLTSCAAPLDTPPVIPPADDASVSDQTEPLSEQTVPEETEPETFPIEEQITNFKVLTDEEKSEQRRLRAWPPERPLPIVEWEKVAKSCPYTMNEILSMISVGDNLEDVYEKIGYPNYRDILTLGENGVSSLNREFDYLFMYYKPSDGGTVWIKPKLAGCTEENYRYLVAEISYRVGANDNEYLRMDFDTQVSLEMIPVFMAVEEKGVEYLLEKNLITPYEATLYAEEEARYQASVAAKEAQEQANE